MRMKNLVLTIGLVAVVTSFVFAQSESFVPKDLTAKPNTLDPDRKSVV